MKKNIILIFLAFIGFNSIGQKKNIILIAVDDLNDWIGVLGGHPQTITPNIDKLASKGVVFTNASCPSPVCNPSRTAFMLGRRPHETGISSNSDGSFRDDNTTWIKNITSMPQYFTQKGFETVAQGKIFHTHEDNNGEFEIVGPGGQGCNAGVKDIVPNTKIEWSESTQKLTETGDYKSAKWCGDYLKQNHNDPFFLACGIFRPHLPWFAPKEFYDKLPAIDNIILPPYLKNDRNDTYGGSNQVLDDVMNNGGERRWKETVRAYLANVAFADACVGKLLDDLENSPYKNNTIVVLIGDHGWHLGEKDHYQKFTMWERSIKTPMIIYDAADGKSGICNKAVSLMDIFPTLLEATNTAKPTFKISGRSIYDLIKNPNADWCGVALTTYGGGDHSIRTDRYRYIQYKTGKEELYDHETDPNEWTNQVGKTAYEAILQKHRAILAEMLNGEENPNLDCESPILSINIQTPTNNQTFEIGETVTITTNPQAKKGVKKVEFYIDNNLFQTELTVPFSMSTNSLTKGIHTIKAKIIDNENNSDFSNPISITISDTIVPPIDINDLSITELNCKSLKIRWTFSTGADAYRIRRKEINETVFTNIGDVTTNIFVDSTIIEGKQYIYMVRPMFKNTAVAISNQVEAIIPPCPKNPIIPSIIEAESFVTEFGIETTATSDTSGIKHIRKITTGDFTTYNLNVSETNSYLLSVRYTSGTQGGKIILWVDGQNKGEIELENTGAWGNWSTKSTSINLEKGDHEFKMEYINYGTEVYSFDINYFKFEIASTITSTSDQNKLYTIYPNPTTGLINIVGYEKKWEIYNMQSQLQISGIGSIIDLTSLPNSVYILQFNNQSIFIQKQ